VVTITDRAREHVRKLINDNKMGDVHLRFSVTGGGCSGFNYNLTFAKEPEAGDQVLEYGGLRIFVEKLSRLYVNDTQIDWEETLYGSGFTFSNEGQEHLRLRPVLLRRGAGYRRGSSALALNAHRSTESPPSICHSRR
jgi:iron-sulfur cluster assembly protein